MALNAKQRRFVTEYLRDGNASAAAVRAGYSENGAGQIAYKLLKKAEIARLVADGQRKIEEKVGLSLDECFARMADEANNAESARDRLAALSMIAKLQHKCSEHVEHSGSLTYELVHPYLPASDDEEGGDG